MGLPGLRGKADGNHRRGGQCREHHVRGPAACIFGSGLPSGFIPSSRTRPPQLPHCQRGTVAGVIARGTGETPSGGISIASADPSRVQHSYEYASTDELQMPGIANALASDLRMSLASGLDNKVVDDLVSALTRVAIASTVTTASLIAAVHGVVDGKAARYFNEVRLLAGNTVGGQPDNCFRADWGIACGNHHRRGV